MPSETSQISEPPSTSLFSSHSKNFKTEEFRKKWFYQVVDSDWNDWRWQLKNRLCSNTDLQRIFSNYQEFDNQLPIAITPYYASVAYNSVAISKTVIPTDLENLKSQGEAEDPLCEESQMPVKNLIHRYPTKVLLLVTDFCSTNCRYCVRSRFINSHKEEINISQAIEYISKNSQIKDVIVSGGDPMLLTDKKINNILSKLYKIEHVQIIRIGTKIPVVLPQRITTGLLDILDKYWKKLYVNIHLKILLVWFIKIVTIVEIPLLGNGIKKVMTFVMV